MRGCGVQSKRRRIVGVVELPKGVHRVVARGREYFYWQPGRGTQHAAPRVRLPDDPQQPDFWAALRQAQGIATGPHRMTVGDVLDAYLTSPKFLKLSKGSQEQYRGQARVVRLAWDKTPADAMKPRHVREVVEGLSDTPGKANNFLSFMRALSAFGVVREHFPASITAGVEPYAKEGGHKPWTDKQIAAAHEHLTGMVRRGIMLALYTGQRGSDIVRLGPTDVDDGGFALRQQKTGREVWCPIVPELAAEMATWELRPGPFLLMANDRPYSRKRLWVHFDQMRETIPALADVTIHGLRATAVVRLRREGLSTAQIQDIIGMSMAMIERYSRFADRKASGKAAVIKLTRKA
jgi:integrase